MNTEPVGVYSGIPLSKFLTPYVTGNISFTAVRIYSVDESLPKEYTKTQLEKSYFIPSEEFLAEFDSSGEPIPITRVDYPVRIWIPGTAANPDISKPAPPLGEYR
jgi:hypothetical protein